MYKLAIFDMDGTILNTIDDLADSCNVICEKYGYPLHTVEEIKYMVGNGIPKLMRRALPQDIEEEQFIAQGEAHYERFAFIGDEF